MDVKQARQMVDAVKKAGVVNDGLPQLPTDSRDSPGEKMIAAGELGRIYHYRARYAQDWIV